MEPLSSGSYQLTSRKEPSRSRDGGDSSCWSSQESREPSVSKTKKRNTSGNSCYAIAVVLFANNPLRSTDPPDTHPGHPERLPPSSYPSSRPLGSLLPQRRLSLPPRPLLSCFSRLFQAFPGAELSGCRHSHISRDACSSGKAFSYWLVRSSSKTSAAEFFRDGNDWVGLSCDLMTDALYLHTSRMSWQQLTN